MPRWICALALLTACKTGAITIDTDETDVGDDTEDTDVVEDPPNPFAGTWAGDVDIMNDTWGQRMCQGTITLTVDDHGVLGGEGTCTGGWSGDEEYDVSMTGTIDPDTGAIVGGEVTFQYPTGRELADATADVTGNADGSDLEADWSADIDTGGMGTVTLVGEIDALPR